MRLSFLILVLLASPASAAQGRIAFDAETLDLGRIAEADGGVSRTFRFTNTGDAPVRLVQVDAACGCTTPAWTDAPVEPGAVGTVEVTYDPAGRPGPFEKAVFVQAKGAEPAARTLRVSGVVESVLAQTGVRVGSLAFDKTVADVGTVAAGDGFQLAFQFANLSGRPVRIDSVEAPEGVQVVFPRRAVFSDGLGGLFITAEDARVGRRTSGHGVEVDLIVHTDDAEEPVKTLRVVGTLDVIRAREDGVVRIQGGGE